MTHILLAVIYLAFISLGLPDSLLGAAWPSMYGELGVPVSPCRNGLHDHLLWDNRIQPPEQPAHQPVRPGKGDGCQRGGHGGGSPGLFRKPFLLAALPLGRSLRAGSRKRGCSPQPLCGPSLQKPPYELASLYVGRGRFPGPVGHGDGPCGRIWLEHGLPGRGPGPDGAGSGPGHKPALMENEARKREGQERNGSPDRKTSGKRKKAVERKRPRRPGQTVRRAFWNS